MVGDVLIENVAAAMSWMTRFGAAAPLRSFRRCVGFDGALGRRGGGTKGSFLGVALLVAQASFEANDFFLQPVNDPLLFQTAWAIAGWEFRRVLAGRSGVALLAVVAQQFRAHLVEELFQSFAVAQRLLQLRDKFVRNVHAAASALIGERKDESRMLVAAGAGRAIGTHAGLADLGQGPLDGGPELFEVLEEVLTERRIREFGWFHGMY